MITVVRELAESPFIIFAVLVAIGMCIAIAVNER